MPSRRHSSATLCSPRSPSSATRIFSSAELLARRPANVSHDPLGRQFGGSGFLAHLHSSTVTMSQKSSFPQTLESVSQALTPDTADGLIFLPPFPPAAERCALTAELSIRTCAGGPPA